MKLNITHELANGSTIGRLILNCLCETLTNEEISDFADKNSNGEGVEAELTLTINGIDLDLEKFMAHWQSQVTGLIQDSARNVVSDRFGDVSDLLYDLQERLAGEIDKRLEDWEKDAVVQLKSSEEWQKLCRVEVLDPDGWDRHGDFHYSWHVQKISKEEFEKRLCVSTCQHPRECLRGEKSIWKDHE